MAGEELHDKYKTCVCCKMLCPITDCTEIELDQQPEHLTAVLKPHKCALYFLPLPCVACCCGICCNTIDVHSKLRNVIRGIIRILWLFTDVLTGLDKSGNLRISRHGICSSQEETHEDIVSMGLDVGLAQMMQVGRAPPQFKYSKSDGSTVPLVAPNCAPAFNRVYEKQNLGNTTPFGYISATLLAAETSSGGQGFDPSAQVQTLLSQLATSPSGGAQVGGIHSGLAMQLMSQNHNQQISSSGGAQHGGMQSALQMQAMAQQNNQHSASQVQPASYASGNFGNMQGYPTGGTSPNQGVSQVQPVSHAPGNFGNMQGYSMGGPPPNQGVSPDPSTPHGHGNEAVSHYDTAHTATAYQPDEPPPSYQI